jgi:ATP-dependent Clp protease ATP-binding subunit ClpC
MFERFTSKARKALVFAEEAARDLNHNYLGTEHMLLGLLPDNQSVAARVLESLDIATKVIRTQIEDIVIKGAQPSSETYLPFTPKAKKVLEFSLREALQLEHNYIGTEHLLLGIIREGESGAAQVMQTLGADLNRVRTQVLAVLEIELRKQETQPVNAESSFEIVKLLSNATDATLPQESQSIMQLVVAGLRTNSAEIAPLLKMQGIDAETFLSRLIPHLDS